METPVGIIIVDMSPPWQVWNAVNEAMHIIIIIFDLKENNCCCSFIAFVVCMFAFLVIILYTSGIINSNIGFLLLIIIDYYMIHYLQYLFYLYTIPSITSTFYKSKQTSTLHQFQLKLALKNLDHVVQLVLNWCCVHSINMIANYFSGPLFAYQIVILLILYLGAWVHGHPFC